MQDLVQLKDSPLLNANKDEMSGMVSSYIQELAMHGGNPVLDLALCKKYIFLLEELSKNLTPFADEELSKYDNSEAKIAGAELKRVESGVKYDYSSNKVWAEQKSKVEEEAAKLKDIEAFTKGLKSKTTIVDETTGETFEYFPPVKSSATTVRVTIK
jgi:hypothetical protein